MGEGMGKISWAEFEAAVKKANRPKPPTPPPQESSSSQEAAAAAAMARQAAEDMAKSTAEIAEPMASASIVGVEDRHFENGLDEIQHVREDEVQLAVIRSVL